MANHIGKNFDRLPDCAFVRLPMVQALFACSAATIWRRVAEQRIPRPVKLSHRVTAWNVGQLRAALASVLVGNPSREGGCLPPRDVMKEDRHGSPTQQATPGTNEAPNPGKSAS
jgi:predicted DNA-binding transcriptional regulator AlpA